MEQIKRSKKAGFPAFNQMARWDLRAFKAQMMLMASGSDKSGLFIVSRSRFQKVSFKLASGIDTPRSGMHKKWPWGLACKNQKSKGVLKTFRKVRWENG